MAIQIDITDDPRVEKAVERFLHSVTYKPGWLFRGTVFRGSHGIDVTLEVDWPTVEVSTSKPTTFTYRRTVHAPDGKPFDVSGFVRETVAEVELHEAAEWLRIGDQLVAQSHEGGKVFRLATPLLPVQRSG